MTFDRQNLDLFRFELLNELLDRARVTIRPKIPSRQLQRSLTKRVNIKGRNAKGDLFIREFWALFVHDGRRGFGPKKARFLVFFADERDDPRLVGGRPVKGSDVRTLTKQQFQEGIAENKRLELASPGGGPMQHMIVVKEPTGRPGRVGPSRGTFFFTEGAQAFERQVDDIVFKRFDAFVRANVPTECLRTQIRLG